MLENIYDALLAVAAGLENIAAALRETKNPGARLPAAADKVNTSPADDSDDNDLSGDDSSDNTGEEVVTLAIVQDAVRTLCKNKLNNPKVAKVLAKFKAKRATELDEGDYVAAYAELLKIK